MIPAFRVHGAKIGQHLIERATINLELITPTWVALVSGNIDHERATINLELCASMSLAWGGPLDVKEWNHAPWKATKTSKVNMLDTPHVCIL